MNLLQLSLYENKRRAVLLDAQQKLIDLGFSDVEFDRVDNGTKVTVSCEFKILKNGIVKTRSWSNNLHYADNNRVYSSNDTVNQFVKWLCDDIAIEIDSMLENWMTIEQCMRLVELMLDQQKLFRSTYSPSAASNLQRLGWTLFAHEKNGDSDDYVLYK